MSRSESLPDPGKSSQEAAPAVSASSGELSPSDQQQNVDPAVSSQLEITDESDHQEEVDFSFSSEQHEAFAAHVSFVRKDGDALNIPLIRQKILGFKTLAPAAVTGPMIGYAIGYTPTMPLGLALITIGAGGYSWIRKIRSFKQNTHRMDRAAQWLLGEHYDLYRLPRADPEDSSHRIVMHYHGPGWLLDEEKVLPNTPKQIDMVMTGPERIHRIAQLAEENGVDEIIIGQDLAKTVGVNDLFTPITDFLQQERGIPLNPKSDLKNTVVVSRSPKTWIAKSAQAGHQEQRSETVKKIDALDKQEAAKEVDRLLGRLVDSLAETNPLHPMIAVYAQYKGQSALLRTKMLGIMQQDVHRTYSEIGTNRPPATTQARLGLDPEKSSENMPARIGADGRSVVLRDSRGFDSAPLPLEDIVGMSVKAMVDYLAHPHDSPTFTTEVIVALIAEQLHKERPIPHLYAFFEGKHYEVAEKRVAARFHNGRTTQEKLFLFPELPTRVNNINYEHYDRRTWVKKLFYGMVSAALLCGASIMVANEADDIRKEQLTIAKEQIAAENGIDLTRQGLDPSEYVERADENSVVARVWGDWKSMQRDLDEWLKDAFSPEPGSSPLKLPGWAVDSLYSPNIAVADDSEYATDSGAAQQEWKLEATQGMPTTGYWTISTANKIDTSSEYGLHWKASTELSGASMLLAAELNNDRPSIKVTHFIEKADTLILDDQVIIRVPIREGTRITAAHVDGRPLNLEYFKDGTTALWAHQRDLDDSQGNLTYWVQEPGSGPFPNGARPRAIAPILIDSEFARDMVTPTQEIKDRWEQRIPGFWEMGPYGQIEAVEGYIETNFNYRLKPFGEEFDHTVEPLPDYVDRLTNNLLADCAASNTILALSTQDPALTKAVLNFVDGYNNDTGSGADVLSSRESHAYTVDTYGKFYDATPTKGITAADAAWLNGEALPGSTERSKETPLPFALLALSGAIILGSTAHYVHSQMPQIRRARRRMHERLQQYRQRELKVMEEQLFTFAGERGLFSAVEAVNNLAYDPSQNIASALARAQHARPAGSLRTSAVDIVVPPTTDSFQALRRVLGYHQLPQSPSVQNELIANRQKVLAAVRTHARHTDGDEKKTLKAIQRLLSAVAYVEKYRDRARR